MKALEDLTTTINTGSAEIISGKIDYETKTIVLEDDEMKKHSLEVLPKNFLNC